MPPITLFKGSIAARTTQTNINKQGHIYGIITILDGSYGEDGLYLASNSKLKEIVLTDSLSDRGTLAYQDRDNIKLLNSTDATRYYEVKCYPLS